MPIQVELVYDGKYPHAFEFRFHVDYSDDEEVTVWAGSIECLIESLKTGSAGYGDLVFHAGEENFVIHMASSEGIADVDINLEAIKDFVSQISDEVEESIKNFQITDEDIEEWLRDY